MKTRSIRLIIFTILNVCVFPAFSQPVLLRELPDNSQNFITSNGKLFFTIGDSLWKSNGTPGGTVFVKEIGEPIQRLTDITVGTFFYFLTTEPGGNTALWKSNGTSINTFKIASHPVINPLLNFNNALILGINDGSHGYELWRVTAGNIFTLVRDIYPGVNSGLGDEIVSIGDWLYFKATTGAGGINIWKSNATSVTSLVANLPFDNYNSLTVVNSSIFFARNYENATGDYAEIWKTNGTAAGTTMVKQFFESDSDICEISVSNFLSFNSKLYFNFQGGCGVAIENLWSSDGTEAGTQFVKEVNIDGYISDFMITNNHIIFYGSSQGFPGQITKSNGTTAGTNVFKSLNSEPPGEFETVGSLLFYADHSSATFGNPDSPDDYFQLFQSDLTTANTEPVRDIFGGSYSGAANLRNSNGKLFFTTYNHHPLAPAADRVLRLYYYNPVILLRAPSSASVSTNEGIIAYPNPSTEKFTFSLTSENENLAIAEILTVDGMPLETLLKTKVEIGETVEFTWDAAKYPGGIYICKYRCGEDYKVKKIIKTK